MRVKPILFNTDMVRAILEGRKTVTRRKIDVDISNRFDVEVDGRVICYTEQETGDSCNPVNLCNYWPGDILYVRETWCDRWLPDGLMIGEYRYSYKADGKPDYGYWGNNKQSKENVWIPSIHMPKDAARIWLKVTNVRVERLQDITNDEVLKEGMNVKQIESYRKQMPEDSPEWIHAAYILPFENTWNDTINKSDIDCYGWKANPWVWVIEFERCEKPQEVEV